MAAENGEMTALLRKLIGSLEQQNEQKDELIRQKDEQIAHLEEQIAQLNQTVANLNETVLEFQRKLFGTSSEKTPADAFNEAEAEQAEEKRRWYYWWHYGDGNTDTVIDVRRGS